MYNPLQTAFVTRGTQTLPIIVMRKRISLLCPTIWLHSSLRGHRHFVSSCWYLRMPLVCPNGWLYSPLREHTYTRTIILLDTSPTVFFQTLGCICHSLDTYNTHHHIARKVSLCYVQTVDFTHKGVNTHRTITLLDSHIHVYTFIHAYTNIVILQW